MKKGICILFVIVFFGMCSAPLLGLVLGYKNINAEKRALAAKPVFWTGNGLNASYPVDAENFLSDHYAFKPQLVTADALLRGTIFGESVSEKVILGRNDRLFFSETLDDYLAIRTLSDNEIYRIVRTLEITKEALDQKGVSFVFVVAPNKASICSDDMPRRYHPTGKQNNYDRLYASLAGSDISGPDLRAILRNEKADPASVEALYLKLDSHWTDYGAMLAYRTIVSAIEESEPVLTLPRFEEIGFETRETENGDLGVMLYPASGKKDTQYFFDMPKDYRFASTFRTMEDLLIKTVNDHRKGGILMFRDSFANALIPFFSDAFLQAIYSRAIPYNYGLLTDQTDVVVFEIVERNIENILLSAPIIGSFPVEPVADASPDRIEVESFSEVTEEGVRLYGVAIPSEYDAQADYDILIRLEGADGVRDFVTFPILEPDMNEDTEDKKDYSMYSNVAFSARIERHLLKPGKYTVSILVSGGGETVFSLMDPITISE